MENVRSSAPLAPPPRGPALGEAACPGCGQPVDPLRAGHVAVLEGRGFHYFCAALCKQEYLRLRGRPQEEDVATASPPEVAYLDGTLGSDVATGPATALIEATDDTPRATPLDDLRDVPRS